MQLLCQLINLKSSCKTHICVILLCVARKYFLKNYVIKKNCVFLHANKGALTQLARVSRWQRGSHRFESDMLHLPTLVNNTRVFLLFFKPGYVDVYIYRAV